MASFEVRELSPAIGAEIDGLDLRHDLDRETVAELRALFDDRSVVLLRDPVLPADDQRYLTGVVVGEEAPGDRATTIASTHLYEGYVTNRDADGYAPFGELLFHSDMMWGDDPMQSISLYGFQVTPPSVPTRFASMVHACATLPSELRERVAGLKAIHVNGQQRRGGNPEELVEIDYAEERSTTKPVIWTHPRTGRELLFVSQQMTRGIEGMSYDESEALLKELFAHLYRDDVVFEHDWRQGDLVVWDNLAAQHARGNVQLEGPERTLRKVVAPLGKPLGMTRPRMVDTAAS